MPSPIHAGGLRYHGMSPLVSHLHKLDLIEARAVDQKSTFEAPSSSPAPRHYSSS